MRGSRPETSIATPIRERRIILSVRSSRSSPVAQSMIQSPTSASGSGAVRSSSSLDSRSAVSSPNLRAACRHSRRRPPVRPCLIPCSMPASNHGLIHSFTRSANIVRTSSNCSTGAGLSVPERRGISTRLIHSSNARLSSGCPDPRNQSTSMSTVRSMPAEDWLFSRAISAETRLRRGRSSSPQAPSSSRKYRCEGW